MPNYENSPKQSREAIINKAIEIIKLTEEDREDDLLPQLSLLGAFNRLKSLQNHIDFDIREDPDIENFLKSESLHELALWNVKNILAGKQHSKFNSPQQLKELALAAAEDYEKFGVLDLDKDSELFGSLTSSTS